MKRDEVLEILEPVIEDAIARLQKRTKADSSDVQRIFGPLFESVSRAVGAPAAVPVWEPSAVSLTAVRDALTAIIEAAQPVAVVSEAEIAMRMTRQQALEDELASVRNPQPPDVGWNM